MLVAMEYENTDSWNITIQTEVCSGYTRTLYLRTVLPRSKVLCHGRRLRRPTMLPSAEDAVYQYSLLVDGRSSKEELIPHPFIFQDAG